jgi:hypothetical protein
MRRARWNEKLARGEKIALARHRQPPVVGDYGGMPVCE